MSINVIASGTVTANFAGPHLWSAAHFARQAYRTEEEGKISECPASFFDEVQANVVATVFCSVAAAEAWAGEIAERPGVYFPGSHEEVRGLFLDASRRQNEVAWLKAEVERIRETARTLNIQAAHGAWTLDMLMARFEAGPLRTLLLSVFAFIGGNQQLVDDLNNLIDRCRVSDSLLTQAAASVMAPRYRSSSRAGADPLDVVRHQLPQIVMRADTVLGPLRSI